MPAWGTPTVTLPGLEWWLEHNPQLQCRKLRKGKVKDSIYVGAHLIRYWGKERHKQARWLITHLCCSRSPAMTCQNCLLHSSSHSISPSRCKPLDSHSSTYLWVSSTRAGLPPPYFNISLAKRQHMVVHARHCCWWRGTQATDNDVPSLKHMLRFYSEPRGIQTCV